MDYRDRVIIFTQENIPGMLGDEVKETKSKPIPCKKNVMTHNEQMGIFGKYKMNSFKLHLQGIYEVEKIIFEGQPRMVSASRHHKNSTVLYI